MEWSNQSRYNSFNSYKGLAYHEHYKKINTWLRGEGELPPPIECSLDPIARCNSKCYYCNSQRYLRDNKEEIPLDGRELSYGEMYDLIKFLGKWGVRGLCFGGGGESTLHGEVSMMMGLAHSFGMETALVTNGSMLWDMNLVKQMTVFSKTRWVGISVDAADRETYLKIHGVDMFDKVINNITKLIDAKYEDHAKVDVAFKLLVLPENIDTIYEACKLARDLEIDDFHARPVDLQRKDYKSARELNLDIAKIKEQFAKCHELETDKFHVYTVVHKYDESFHVKHDFKKCLASPLVIQCCTDGNAYVCVDHRIEERFRLGSWHNIMDWWGKDEHRKLLQGINPAEECSRCTWSEYNKQIEEVVQNDKMCLAFP